MHWRLQKHTTLKDDAWMISISQLQGDNSNTLSDLELTWGSLANLWAAARTDLGIDQFGLNRPMIDRSGLPIP